MGGWVSVGGSLGWSCELINFRLHGLEMTGFIRQFFLHWLHRLFFFVIVDLINHHIFDARNLCGCQ